MSYEYLQGPVDLPGAQESSGKILKHRWLAQQLLGRPLKNNEIVLKKDFNKEYSKDNIIVFSQRYCSRRWYSEDKEKYLFEEEPHVYNYDWDKIRKEKQEKTEQAGRHRAENQKLVMAIKEFLNDNKEQTIKEISQGTGIDEKRVRNLCHYYKIDYKKKRGERSAFITLPRKELLDNLNQYDLEKLSNDYDTTYTYACALLKKRGISVKYKSVVVHPFKHLTLKTLEKTSQGLRSKKAVCEQLGVCEENFDVEAKKLGFDKYKFVFNTNEDECEFEEIKETEEVSEVEEKNIESDLVENKFNEVERLNLLEESNIEDNENTSNDSELFTLPFEDENVPSKQEDTSNLESSSLDTEDVYNPNKFNEVHETYSADVAMSTYHISLRDITFLTGRPPEDLVQNGDIEINPNDVDKLKKIRDILTKQNVFELLKHHDANEIAQFYGYSLPMVTYVVSGI